MALVESRLNKLRDERHAREKARIEMLRELNLKKYNKDEPLLPRTLSSVSMSKSKPLINKKSSKNNLYSSASTVRATTAPVTVLNNKEVPQNKNLMADLKPKIPISNIKGDKLNNKTVKMILPKIDNVKAQRVTNKLKSVDIKIIKKDETKVVSNITAKVKNQNKNAFNKDLLKGSDNKIVSGPTNKSTFSRKGVAPIQTFPKPVDSRKSIQPQRQSESAKKANPNRLSVFERLYQPKTATRTITNDIQKLKSDANCFKKVIHKSSLISNKRHTVFETKNETTRDKKGLIRRSISAVHFKRINKNEMPKCIHKWSSIGEKLDKVHLKEINEDATVTEDKIVSAVKSERKKVKFQTPMPNFNTPRPEELQLRLQNWLQKHGKSIDSYHHLQCFGIHHMTRKLEPLNLYEEQFGDEDKENQPLQSDSDNGSYTDNMNLDDRKDDFIINVAEVENKAVVEVAKESEWRRASIMSECADFNETQMTQDQDITLTSTETNFHHVDELLQGTLNDLTELLREGFEWEQCARWLRAIRERFPAAPETAAYWECRAALEETRGDLPASVTCWEEAIAKGTERSVVEANLDQLLDKFMQLKISPTSGKKKPPNPKMVDIKNVFKSTLIRFAVQQAKLRKSSSSPLVTVTPVRRSGRLSIRTPLAVCSVKQAGPPHKLIFRNNDKLCQTP